MKKGREEMKSAARPGRSLRSLTIRWVGWEGQEKRWTGVWGAPLHEGQRESRNSPETGIELRLQYSV